jgi:hypothetical protein
MVREKNQKISSHINRRLFFKFLVSNKDICRVMLHIKKFYCEKHNSVLNSHRLYQKVFFKKIFYCQV